MNDNKNKKIFLFNGPPSSGKDYAAKWMASTYKGCKLDKFARVLKERTHALYGFPWKGMDYYEDCKNEPHEDFYGLTPRQAYINVSETYFKPHHGDRIFGKILAQELDTYDWDIVAISDSGFEGEAQVLVEKYGAENIILVRVHREGYDFSKDSRSYIYLNVCNVDIQNLGDESYIEAVKDLVDSVLLGGTGEATPAAMEVPATYGPNLQPIVNIFHDESKSWQDTPNEIADANTYIKNPVGEDSDNQKKDYVFEDVINNEPSLLTRLGRLIGIK